jgi:hypothetical protein
MDILSAARPGHLPWQTDEDRQRLRESIEERMAAEQTGADRESDGLRAELAGSVTVEDEPRHCRCMHPLCCTSPLAS